jgi:chromosome segregation ATPase
LETERERHIKEIQSLKKEINAFTSQLKEKNAQIKVLGEKSTHLESALKLKDAEIARVNEELIVI